MNRILRRAASALAAGALAFGLVPAAGAAGAGGATGMGPDPAVMTTAVSQSTADRCPAAASVLQ